MKELEELKILNNRSGLMLMLIKKDHMSLTVCEAVGTTQEYVDASTFFNKEQAKEIMVYLSEFIAYDGKHD